MAPRSIVKALDVSKNITSGFLTCCIMLVMDEFGFERVEEALHRSVVIAIGPAARGPEAVEPVTAFMITIGGMLTGALAWFGIKGFDGKKNDCES